MMDRPTQVSVFESDQPAEIQLIKSRLEAAGIASSTENAYMSFTTTPTATSLRLMVDICDEPKAFEIIDEVLKSKQ